MLFVHPTIFCLILSESPYYSCFSPLAPSYIISQCTNARGVLPNNNREFSPVRLVWKRLPVVILRQSSSSCSGHKVLLKLASLAKLGAGRLCRQCQQRLVFKVEFFKLFKALFFTKISTILQARTNSTHVFHFGRIEIHSRNLLTSAMKEKSI